VLADDQVRPPDAVRRHVTSVMWWQKDARDGVDVGAVKAFEVGAGRARADVLGLMAVRALAEPEKSTAGQDPRRGRRDWRRRGSQEAEVRRLSASADNPGGMPMSCRVGLSHPAVPVVTAIDDSSTVVDVGMATLQVSARGNVPPGVVGEAGRDDRQTTRAARHRHAVALSTLEQPL